MTSKQEICEHEYLPVLSPYGDFYKCKFCKKVIDMTEDAEGY